MIHSARLWLTLCGSIAPSPDQELPSGDAPASSSTDAPGPSGTSALQPPEPAVVIVAPSAGSSDTGPTPIPDSEPVPTYWRRPKSRPPHRFGVWAGYLAYEVETSGGQIGADVALAKAGGFQALFTTDLYVYAQRDAEVGYGLQAGFIQRFTSFFGLVVESQFGVGVQATTERRPSVTSPDGNTAVEYGNRTAASFAPWAHVGLGYDFHTMLEIPVRFYVRGGIMWAFPDMNGALATSPVLSTGLAYTFTPSRSARRRHRVRHTAKTSVAP